MTMGSDASKSNRVEDMERPSPDMDETGNEDSEAKKRWHHQRTSIQKELPSSQLHHSELGTSLSRKAMTKERAKKLNTPDTMEPTRRPKTAGAMELRLMQEVNKRGIKADMDDDGDVDELDRLKQIDIVREMPVSLKWKREMRDKLYDMIPDYEESGCSAWLYRRKVKAYMSKRKGKKQWKELSQYFILWVSAMTKIEGNHGVGVLTYFTFLRWLFLVNSIIFLCSFVFLVLPQVVFPVTVRELYNIKAYAIMAISN